MTVPPLPFVCEVCSMMFVTIEELQAHKSQAHAAAAA